METVMLDLDHMPLNRVKYWARRALRFFKLVGLLILESSKDCYHVVFALANWEDCADDRSQTTMEVASDAVHQAVDDDPGVTEER
jgi:hypothetical protein